MIELSDDGNCTQKCGSCKKTFNAPDYYEINYLICFELYSKCIYSNFILMSTT